MTICTVNQWFHSHHSRKRPSWLKKRKRYLWRVKMSILDVLFLLLCGPIGVAIKEYDIILSNQQISKNGMTYQRIIHTLSLMIKGIINERITMIHLFVNFVFACAEKFLRLFNSSRRMVPSPSVSIFTTVTTKKLTLVIFSSLFPPATRFSMHIASS